MVSAIKRCWTSPNEIKTQRAPSSHMPQDRTSSVRVPRHRSPRAAPPLLNRASPARPGCSAAGSGKRRPNAAPSDNLKELRAEHTPRLKRAEPMPRASATLLLTVASSALLRAAGQVQATATPPQPFPPPAFPPTPPPLHCSPDAEAAARARDAAVQRWHAAQQVRAAALQCTRRRAVLQRLRRAALVHPCTLTAPGTHAAGADGAPVRS